MPFEITNESVTVMRDLARKIPDSVERLKKANTDVIQCYEEVKETVGPHTKDIEAIVQKINKMLDQSSESINEIPKKLNKLAERCEEVIRKRPQMDS